MHLAVSTPRGTCHSIGNNKVITCRSWWLRDFSCGRRKELRQPAAALGRHCSQTWSQFCLGDASEFGSLHGMMISSLAMPLSLSLIVAGSCEKADLEHVAEVVVAVRSLVMRGFVDPSSRLESWRLMSRSIWGTAKKVVSGCSLVQAPSRVWAPKAGGVALGVDLVGCCVGLHEAVRRAVIFRSCRLHKYWETFSAPEEKKQRQPLFSTCGIRLKHAAIKFVLLLSW